GEWARGGSRSRVRTRRGVRRRGEVFDLRGDQQFVAVLDDQALPTKAEGIRDVDRQGPDPVPPTHLGEDRVGDPLRPATGNAGHDEASGAPQRRGELVFEHQEGAWSGRAILDVELYRQAGSRPDPYVGETPADRHPSLGPP